VKTGYITGGLLIFLFSIRPVQADGNPDIYDRLAVMAESLRVWVKTPPALVDRVTDRLSLYELFPGASIEQVDSSNSFHIFHPRYMDLLTTELELTFPPDDIDQDKIPIWNVPLRLDGNRLLLDRTAISCQKGVSLDSTILGILSARILELRTIGLPSALQAGSVGTVDSVIITLHGREISEFKLTSKAWHAVLTYLASGQEIYAGLIGVGTQSQVLSPRYYILITTPQADGHHFLDLEDYVRINGNDWKVEQTVVRFIPYIRTDNLKELFDREREGLEYELWDIHLTR